MKPDFTHCSNSLYHLKHFLIFFKKPSAIFSPKSEKQNSLPWKKLYFLKKLCSKSFLYHRMKPDLTYYHNSLLPLKKFLYFLEKKKLAHFPDPSLKNKKIKAKNRKTNKQTNKNNKKSPWKPVKMSLYFWMTADRFSNQRPKIKKTHPEKLSYIFPKKSPEKMILYRRKKFSYICLHTKSIFYYFQPHSPNFCRLFTTSHYLTT